MLKAEGYEAISSSAEHDQHFFPSKRSVSGAQGQAPLQIISPEFVRTYHAKAHETVDAIATAVNHAQAGLLLPRADPPDLEEVRRTLDGIVRDGKRAAEIVIRLQALMKEGAHSGWSSCSLTVR